MSLSRPPVAKIELLIRRSVTEVFDAFADPDTITKFWFDRSSGPLEVGATVHWYWDLFDVSAEVRVLAFEKDRRILLEWEAEAGKPSTVEWKFEARTADTTYVSVVNEGFDGDDDAAVGKAIDSTGGFALVLAAAKAWLEHGIELNIVADRF